MKRSGRERDLQRGRPSGTRGAAGALVIAFLPVLLAAIAALAGLGHAMFWRQRAFQAADFAALAGVQCLDLEQLAAGSVRLLPEQAMSAAEEYARINLGYPAGETAAVLVTVINGTDAPMTDPITGRAHEYPTVCVVVEVAVHFRFGPLSWAHVMRAHADAAVVPR